MSIYGYVTLSLSDADAGEISFSEFLRMLTLSPWRDLLPEDVQEQLPAMVKEEISPHKSQHRAGAGAVTSAGEPSHVIIVRAAKELFDKTDTNGDGKIEEEELVRLCEQVAWYAAHKQYRVCCRCGRSSGGQSLHSCGRKCTTPCLCLTRMPTGL